jgi:hypothetical protein
MAGVVSTVAGNGQKGYFNGEGAGKRSHHPASVVVDKSHGMELLAGIHSKFVEYKHRISLNLAEAVEQVVPACVSRHLGVARACWALVRSC